MAANKVTAIHRLAPPAKDYSEPSEWKLGGSFLLPGSVANPFKGRIYLSATRRYSPQAFLPYQGNSAKSDVAYWRLGGSVPISALRQNPTFLKIDV
jgi:hypothetical protein